MADARSDRTLAALGATIIALASERPLSTITVSELASTAGINRATFYDHFRSPGDLLASVLRPDLDVLRAQDNALRTSAELSTAQIFQIGLTGVAEHVQRFRAVYRRALPDPHDNVTHHILVEHFDESIRQRLALNDLVSSIEADAPPLNHAVAARFLAHGFVGAIEAWLEDDTISQTDLIASIMLSAPTWWTRL
jgi:AcrR family transcriptional regulator